MIDAATWTNVSDGAGGIIEKCVQGVGEAGKVRIGYSGALVVVVGMWFDQNDQEALGGALESEEVGAGNWSVVSDDHAATSRLRRKWRQGA